MRGSDHVLQVEDHFEDQSCHYIVFVLAPDICRRGDLLEALKLRPTGFKGAPGPVFVGQAAQSLMVGLEQLLHGNEDLHLSWPVL